MLNLPNDWQKRRIRENGNVVTGRTPSTKCEEIAKPGNDYNISPSRYIHTGEAEEYRPITEIVEGFDTLKSDAAKTNAALKRVLKVLHV